ncbi:MAG TPA: hypothetical protein VFJ77_05425 [Gaiellaceae bacterium]|nr:hypothetical protein [Gaiellaceae bacterium]
MRRLALLAAALAALAAAGPAAALLPQIPSGSAVGEGVPLKAYASVTPTVHLFGDLVTARVAIVADTKWVDPLRVRVRTDFSPYTEARPPRVRRLRSGRFQQITWTWTLHCLTARCVPIVPPSDKFHVFTFHSAHIDYLRPDGARAYGIDARFPPVEVLSQVSPGLAYTLLKTNQLNWQLAFSPVPRPSYRLAPRTLFAVALGLAGLFALGGLAALGRWALGFRSPKTALAGQRPALERALALFLWAHERGDDTLQRKALERIAGELEPGGHDRSQAARAIAWAPEAPEDEDVQAIVGTPPAGEDA